CELDTNAYPKGIVVPDCERDVINLFRDAFHGEWNYKLRPCNDRDRAFDS
ncbi:MAG TPA: ISAzo13 family transposase, partial [Acetobacteraceae bacterium]